jgi:hypothetical protein
LSVPSDPRPSAVAFAAGDVAGDPGQTVAVPIRASVQGAYPLRVLALNLNVVPVADAPALGLSVRFVPSGSLGQPALNLARGPANYGGAWLDNRIAGISGDGLVGTLYVTIPANAGPDAAYRVEFEHASASPNGVALFPRQTQPGFVTLDRSGRSPWGDSIPNAWRLRYFGALNNILAHPNADADGDGIPNWAEYKAGTNPTDLTSALKLRLAQAAQHDTSTMSPPSARLALRWPTVAGKFYRLEASAVLGAAPWFVIASNLAGTGQDLEFTPPAALDGDVFYRVLVEDGPVSDR